MHIHRDIIEELEEQELKILQPTNTDTANFTLELRNVQFLGWGATADVVKSKVISGSSRQYYALKIFESSKKDRKDCDHRPAAFDQEEKIYNYLEQYKRKSHRGRRWIAPAFFGRYTCREMQVLLLENINGESLKTWASLDDDKKYVNHSFGLYAHID